MPTFSNRFFRHRSRRYRCDRAQYADSRQRIQEAFTEAVASQREEFAKATNRFFAGFTADFVLDTTEKLLMHGRTGVIFEINRGIPSDLSLSVTCKKYENAQKTVETSTGGSWRLDKGDVPGTFILEVSEAVLPLASFRGNHDAVLWNSNPSCFLITYAEAQRRGIL